MSSTHFCNRIIIPFKWTISLPRVCYVWMAFFTGIRPLASLLETASLRPNMPPRRPPLSVYLWHSVLALNGPSPVTVSATCLPSPINFSTSPHCTNLAECPYGSSVSWLNSIKFPRYQSETLRYEHKKYHFFIVGRKAWISAKKQFVTTPDYVSVQD